MTAPDLIRCRQLSSGAAEELAQLSRLAYAVEARVIGDTRLPGLTESPQALRTRPLDWRLLVRDGRILAALGVTSTPPDDGKADQAASGTRGTVDIDRLVVHPAVARCGFGSRLVADVLTGAAAGDHRVTVSTGYRNRPALALYQGFHFRPVGIEEPVPGLPVQHLAWRPRRAVRVLCVDEHGHVLLQRWFDPHTGTSYWEPPGGGLDPGETAHAGAARELTEETGLVAVFDDHPLPLPRDVTWAGMRTITVETLFVGRVPGRQPAITPAQLQPDELGTLMASAWLSPAQLSTLGLNERVEPMAFIDLAHRFAGGPVPGR